MADRGRNRLAACGKEANPEGPRGARGAGRLMAVAGSVGLIRVTSLHGLPTIDEPFDTARYATISIPDEENAFTFFRRATDRFVGQESDIASYANLSGDWSRVSPETLRSLEQNRESLGLWLEGTNRDRAIYMQPGSVTIDTQLPAVQRLRSFARLASYRAFRCRIDGDYAGMWTWIKAGLRAGMLTGQNGFPIERLVGIQHYGVAAGHAQQWADDPKVGADLLRKALDDVVAAEAIAPDYASMTRFEYYSAMNTLTDPEATARGMEDSIQNNVTPSLGRSATRRLLPAYAFLRREPERSRRVARLIIANWLWAVDRPAADRVSRLGRVRRDASLPASARRFGTDRCRGELWSGSETTAYAKLARASGGSTRPRGPATSGRGRG